MHQRVGEADRALNSAFTGREPRDIGTLPAGFSVHRSHLTFYLPEGWRELWKSHDSEVLDSGPSDTLGRKHTLACMLEGGVSVFSYLAQKLTSLLWLLCDSEDWTPSAHICLAAYTCSQEAATKLQGCCFDAAATLSQWDLPLAREIGAFDHLAFLCCSNSLLKFL
jgi:hypothetical protein